MPRVIDFFGLTADEAAETAPAAYQRVLDLVKPEPRPESPRPKIRETLVALRVGAAPRCARDVGGPHAASSPRPRPRSTAVRLPRREVRPQQHAVVHRDRRRRSTSACCESHPRRRGHSRRAGGTVSETILATRKPKSFDRSRSRPRPRCSATPSGRGRMAPRRAPEAGARGLPATLADRALQRARAARRCGSVGAPLTEKQQKTHRAPGSSAAPRTPRGPRHGRRRRVRLARRPVAGPEISGACRCSTPLGRLRRRPGSSATSARPSRPPARRRRLRST